MLVFLGVESNGHPGLSHVGGTLYIDADGESAELEALWRETVERSPVAQSLAPAAKLEVHLDTDEGNAVNLAKASKVELFK